MHSNETSRFSIDWLITGHVRFGCATAGLLVTVSLLTSCGSHHAQAFSLPALLFSSPFPVKNTKSVNIRKCKENWCHWRTTPSPVPHRAGRPQPRRWIFSLRNDL